MNVRSYLTFLSRNKVYTAANVFGLSVSLMFVVLIGIYVWQENSVADRHSKAGRIEVLGLRDKNDKVPMMGIHHVVQKHLCKQYPEIEAACGVCPLDVRVTKGDEYLRTTALTVDTTFFRVFDYRLTEGDPATCLIDKEGVVLTESFARTLFGRTDVMGRTVVWRDSMKLHVTGVLEDVDNDLFQRYGMLMNTYNQRYGNWTNTDEAFEQGMVNFTGSNMFLLLRPGATFVGREKELARCYATFWDMFRTQKAGDEWYYAPAVERLADCYLSESDKLNAMRGGSALLVRILGIVALVILLFAIMNNINLTVAQSGKRAREMAARRLYGARRSTIALQFMGESLMLCALAFVLSLALAAAFAPAFGHLLHTTISMKALLSPVIVATLLVLLAVVGVVSGIIPAVVASKVQPITIIRGAFVHKTKMVFSRVFIVVQNVITITMLACSLAMFAQMRHLIHAPMGFRQEGLLMVEDLSKEWEAFAEELRRLPCVKTVTPSCGTPIDGGNNYTIVDREGFKNMSIQFFVVEPAFFSVYGLRLADGSQPVPGHYYLNRKMINDIKASPKLGDPRHFTRQIPMYGVSEDAVYGGEFCDFRIRDIQQEQHPMLIYVTDKMMNRPWNLTVELTGNLEAGYKEVAKVYDRVFREPMTADMACFVDQRMQEQFEDQVRASRIVTLFALVAILISLLGLVAMSTYFIQQCQQEIAIRKVFGATSSQMRMRLVRTFLTYVLIAFVVALPIIWYVMSGWMTQFSYRTVWWPWIGVAGTVVLLISLAAVAVQSYVAANENPVNHLKENH